MLFRSNRSQSVSVNGETFQSFDVKYGVPQGSCLGPLLFILYVSNCSLSWMATYQNYTYTSMTHHFTSPSNLSLNIPLKPTQLSKRASLKWMLMDKLMLNDEKTEFIVIRTRQQLAKVDIDSLCVSHTEILPSSEVRNLGAG